MIKYRVMLSAEDGDCVLDEFFSELDAYGFLEHISDNYGDGQTVYVKAVRL